MLDRVFPKKNKNTQEESIDKIFSIYTARPSRPILITENKRDEAVYKKAFEGHSYVSTVKEFCNADGRSNVISFISSIKEKDEAWTSKAKIRGIIDRDLALSNNRLEKHSDNNCFVTDFSEMEMYAFLNEDFSSFINQNLPMEYCLPYPETIELILRITSPLGAVRVIAHNPIEFYIQKEDEPIGFDYENFDFRVEKKKSFIDNIEEENQDKIIIEVVKNISKSPHGAEIIVKVLDLTKSIKSVLGAYDIKLLVNSKMFESCLCRYILSPGRVKNNKDVRKLISAEEFFIKDARKFLISHPNIIAESELGRKVANLTPQG